MNTFHSKGVFRITARGLIIQDEQLLFVSDDGQYWYTPGGRLEGEENLKECVEREIYEETGLQVKSEKLLYVLECFDLSDHQHKIHFYFQTTVIKGNITETWQDAHGSVKYRRFFSLKEIKEQKNIVPRFLAAGTWAQPFSENIPVYQGSVTMRGFEVVENLTLECIKSA